MRAIGTITEAFDMAADLERGERPEAAWTPVPESAFACKICGVACPIAPADDSGAICEAHCEDHEFQYERGEGWRCIHCFAERPEDFFDDDDRFT